MSSINQVFCDCLDVTFPPDEFHAILPGVLEIGYESGGSVVSPGLMQFIRVRDKALEIYGAIKFGLKYGVGRISTSGASLGALRGANTFERYLMALSAGAYRVTRLDATLDQIGDGPAVTAAVAERVRCGKVQLSRKTLVGRNWRHITGACLVPGDDRLTGTVYIGTRKQDVRATIYDKRQELLFRGFSDPGPLVRYELGFGRHFPCTLRDAAQPEALFWKYAGRSLLKVPSHIAEWTAMSDDDLGFKLEKKDRDVPHIIEKILENSADVAKLLTLADELGPGGRQYLARHLLRVGRPNLTLVAGDSTQ